MPEIEVKRKHYHDGGDIEEGLHALSTNDQTISCGWYWIPLNPWLRWKWRRELRAYRTSSVPTAEAEADREAFHRYMRSDYDEETRVAAERHKERHPELSVRMVMTPAGGIPDEATRTREGHKHKSTGFEDVPTCSCLRVLCDDGVWRWPPAQPINDQFQDEWRRQTDAWFAMYLSGQATAIRDRRPL